MSSMTYYSTCGETHKASRVSSNVSCSPELCVTNNASFFGSIQIPMYGILHAGARVIIEMSFISSNHSASSVNGLYDLGW